MKGNPFIAFIASCGVGVEGVYYSSEEADKAVEVAKAMPVKRSVKAIANNSPWFLVIVTENIRDVGEYNKLDKDKIERWWKKMECPRCHGSGTIECPRCHGEGGWEGLFGDYKECPNCGGSGEVECPNCGGTGYVEG